VQEAVKFPAEGWEQPASPSITGSSAASSPTETAPILRAGWDLVDALDRLQVALGEPGTAASATSSSPPSPNSDRFCLTDDEGEGDRTTDRHHDQTSSGSESGSFHSALEDPETEIVPREGV
jgi:hypothetical protein